MYDARDDILNLFKQITYDNDLKSYYYIAATDGTNTKNIRVCKSEEADTKALPLVVLSLADATSLAADISGNVRQDVCLVDCHIYMTRTASYDWKAMLDDVVDEITTTIWNNQASVTNTFIECIAMRDLTKLEKTPVTHRLIEIRAIKINSK